MLNIQDFALLRAKSLGGSDIGPILGLSKYRSPLDVWMEKTGKMKNEIDNLPIRFGKFAEEFVATEYELATGFPLVEYPRAIVHPDYDYMHGHVDRFICFTPAIYDENGHLIANRILECKTANPFTQSEWGETGTDQVPLPYLVQCVWYMMITNIDQADLAVLFGNADFRIYEIQRDHELEQMVMEKAMNFWENHVLKDIPPEPSNERDLKQLFKNSTSNKSVESNSEMLNQIKQIHQINQAIEKYESEISQIKQSIMNHMQDAELLTYQGQTIATWKSPKPSFRLDAKKFAIEHPDLASQYQVAIQNNRRLTIKELS